MSYAKMHNKLTALDRKVLEMKSFLPVMQEKLANPQFPYANITTLKVENGVPIKPRVLQRRALQNLESREGISLNSSLSNNGELVFPPSILTFEPNEGQRSSKITLVTGSEQQHKQNKEHLKIIIIIIIINETTAYPPRGQVRWGGLLKDK
eukprot:TRINITY_DN1682_c0_g1_i10.p1 TRINITY_DN1682_c0_g1~~TRINITY_DN1682_c0_g1_i10.p1  ORF type:complete len:151 (+),score=17.01 TRINITY_DN1682_c0_g1_i10:121-573(+)